MTPLRRTALPLLVLYVGCVLWLTMQPSAGTAGWGVTRLSDVLLAVGLPARLAGPEGIEVLLNVVMLVPLPVLGMASWPTTTWRDWTAYGFLLSLAIEATQLVVPGRSATATDLAANTAGALVGGLVTAVWLRRRGRAGGSPR